MSLPPEFSPESLVFKEASEAEKMQSWQNNSVAWAGKMTTDQYIGQQKANGDRAISLRGGIRYWVLTDGSEVYCSAENTP